MCTPFIKEECEYMKKSLVLLPLIAVMLTGCLSSGLSKEKFQTRFDKVKANMVETNETLKNVTIKDKLSVNVYQYKEGEFYSYKMTAILLIVPIMQGTYTWKEDGKFYHAETHTDSKKDKLYEITEQQFNDYMVSHKAKILSELNAPVNLTETLLSEQHEGYTSVKNKYSKNMFSKDFKLSSTVTYQSSSYSDGSEVTEEKTKTYTVQFSNFLPKTYSYKDGDSSGKTTYTYGKAEFTKPGVATNDSSSEQ